MQAKLLFTRLNFRRPSTTLRQFPLTCFLFHSKAFYSDLVTKEPLITPKRIINKTPGLNLSISERASNRLAEIYRNMWKVVDVTVSSTI
ncbi:ATV_HP_G0028750.mRNA.1.CDS.1 [Saccharomyces cerevisiae]|nr:ATV_HP_G0028750.mRNA.1.CDS.1 [Saccharomyces cerevisiae]CAI6964344.1 ATV_HP_G0028750.mRNA.1.CDS.1 [Saccharomyces cerevisiae]